MCIGNEEKFNSCNSCISVNSLTHDFKKSLTCWGQAQSAVSLVNCFSVKRSQVL